MHEYTRISAYLLPRTLEGEEFADALFTELAPWGKDQTFTGLTHGTPSPDICENYHVSSLVNRLCWGSGGGC